MKILHLGKYYSPFEGGMENFLAALIKAQKTAGIDHTVLAHHHHPWHRTTRENFPEGMVVRVFILCRLLFAPIAPGFFSQLKKQLAETGPDIIHVHMPNLSAFWLLLLGRRLRMPVIVHWHADVIPSRRNLLLSLAYLFYRPLEKRLLRRATAIIATSPDYLDTSVPLQPFKDKCHVIPLGVNSGVETAPVNGSQYWRQENSFKVLCVGRLTYYKGQQYLIEAVSRVMEAELILVGTGQYMDRYRSLVSRLGCGDRVTLFGHAQGEQLDAMLATCDCLCLPSIERTEAFGLVLLEAMAHARPCICTDVAGSGMSWVVRHDHTGLVARHGDSNALEDAIRLLGSDRGKARELGKAGYDRYKALFSMNRVADEIASLYNHVLDLPKGQ